jgi:threonyl-tRNA synthetase
VPYLIVVGAAELEQGGITVESYFDGKLEEIKSVDALATKMKDEIAKKTNRRRS